MLSLAMKAWGFGLPLNVRLLSYVLGCVILARCDPCTLVCKVVVMDGASCSLNVLRGSSIGTAASTSLNSFRIACRNRLTVHSELLLQLVFFIFQYASFQV